MIGWLTGIAIATGFDTIEYSTNGTFTGPGLFGTEPEPSQPESVSLLPSEDTAESTYLVAEGQWRPGRGSHIARRIWNGWFVCPLAASGCGMRTGAPRGLA